MQKPGFPKQEDKGERFFNYFTRLPVWMFFSFGRAAAATGRAITDFSPELNKANMQQQLCLLEDLFLTKQKS